MLFLCLRKKEEERDNTQEEDKREKKNEQKINYISTHTHTRATERRDGV